MNKPRISIIILNWNGLKYTVDCLESLKRITYPNYEIIVVDNNSGSNEADALEKKYKGYIRLIRNKENLGFAEGNNVAIREVIKEGKSDYIVLLNNDTIMTESFLDELAAVAEKDERIGTCSAKILRIDDHKIIDSTGHTLRAGMVMDRGQGKLDKKQYDNKTNVIGASASGALYRRKLFEDIGLFKKEFSGYDDGEFSWRTLKNKWRARFVPSAIIYHYRGASTFQSEDKEIIFKFEKLFFDSSIKVLNLYGSWIDKLKFLIIILLEIGINLFKVILNWHDKEKRKRIISGRIKCLQMVNL